MQSSRRLDDALKAERRFEWSEALRVYTELRTAPDPVDRCRALVGLARCLLQTRNRGETDDAIDALEEARALAAEIGDPLLEGQQLLQQGHIDEHYGHPQRALERYEEAAKLLSQCGGAEFIEACVILASAERRRGELTRALTRLRSELSSANLEPRLQAEYQDELGAVLIARGEHLEAIRELRRALDIHETSTSSQAGARSRLLLAEALRHNGDFEEARALIDSAIATYREQKAPLGLSEAYAQLGLWHEDNESYAPALRAFQDSLRQDELSDDRVGQARAKRHMARVFRKSGDPARAHELLADARDVLSGEDDVEMALLWQEEGELAMTGPAPNYTRAIERFQDACEVAIKDGDERVIAIAQRHLARAYRENDDLEEAERLLTKARVELEKRGDQRELNELLDDLGEVYFEQDHYERAKEVLEASLALDEQQGRLSSKARSLLLLGRVAHESGEHDSAHQYLEQAMDVYSSVKQNVGLSDVFQHMAAWYLDRGQAKQAIDFLRKGLMIDTRLDDPLGRTRARRLLASAYRQQGDLERAEECLNEARLDLGQIKDPVEHALLDCEKGRIDLAAGATDDAARRLRSAQKVFETVGQRPVDVATCQRLRAMAAAHRADYKEALDLLDDARSVFEERKDLPELDDLHDDLAEVWLMQDQLDRARASVNESLAVGNRSNGWSFGRGRSLLLLAAIGLREGPEARAFSREHINEAIALYADQRNEAGRCRAFIALGDWRVAEGKLDDAIPAYKKARSGAHHLRDVRKAATCNRKLAAIYLDRHEVQRAEDALRDATESLESVSDPRERAPLELEWGRLFMAREQHEDAKGHLRRAIDGFRRLHQDSEHRLAVQLLSTCFQATGETRQALECLREMGRGSTSMYHVLIKDLHPRVAQASSPNFENGNFKEAVNAAFCAVEEMIKDQTAKLTPPLKWDKDFSEHVNVLVGQAESWGNGIKRKKRGIEHFRDFIVGSKEFFFNPSKHDKVAFTPASAFAAISAAHVIAETIEHRELPWLAHDID